MATELDTRPSLPPADALHALAIGAVAGGALALGAVVVGALAIGRLAIRRGTIKSLHIGDRTVDRLRIRDQPEALRGPSADHAPCRRSRPTRGHRGWRTGTRRDRAVLTPPPQAANPVDGGAVSRVTLA
jgi:hypothetical protein